MESSIEEAARYDVGRGLLAKVVVSSPYQIKTRCK